MDEPKPLLELHDDDAALIAGWYAVVYDLRHVISATELLLGLLQQEERDGTIVRSLWSSALVAYARCFGSGRRARLDQEIYSDLPGDPLATHRYYKDTRDKHIAHPVNAFEEVRMGMMLDNSGAPVGIGHLAAFRICDAAEGVAQLGQLASFALGHVQKIIQRLETTVLTRAKENPAGMTSLKPLRIQPQGGADAARSPRARD